MRSTKILFLALLGWLAWSPDADAGYVQECHNGVSSPGTTMTCTFGVNVTTGNTVVCGGYGQDATGTFTLSDTQSNTYTNVESYYLDTTSNERGRTSYSQGVTGGFTVVTATWGVSNNHRGLACHEVSGVSASPHDGRAGQYQSAVLNSTDEISSTAVTTTANGDYIFSITYMTDGTCTAVNAGTNFTGVILTGCQFPYTEYRIQPLAGSQAGTFTNTWTGPNRTVTMMQALKMTAATGASGLLLRGVGR